ncbi:hypothetical protein [Salinibacterium sp. GXW1014]|uniref:hypothetical protein n=1 Tax=Salinibacterium sp. GXW1014 TaxID=3377838 RepID=UPI00383A3C84
MRAARNTLASVITVMLCALLAAGCSADTAQPQPGTDSPAPAFESDEAALAAAEAALAEFWEMNNRILQEGGAEPERIAAVVTADAISGHTDSLSRFAASARKQEGSIDFDRVALQQWYGSATAATVMVTLCVDNSQRQVYENGDLLDLTHVPARQAFEAKLTSDGEAGLRLDRMEPWPSLEC